MFSRMERVRIKEYTMQDSWSTVLYMRKKSMNLLGTAGAWWLVAACVPCSLGCWCSLTGVMLAADGEAGSKVFWLLWSSSAWVWSLTVLCSVWEDAKGRDGWSAREGSQRMEVVMVVIRMDGGSCGHQLSSLVITAGCSTALAVPASLSARRPVRVNTCSVELCDLWFTVHITELYLTKHW